jgi:ABC-2 type transport system permease protein
MTDTTQEFSTLTSLPLLDTRSGVVFWRTVRDNFPGAVAWGLGYGALLIAATVLYPLLDKSNTVFTVLNGLGIMSFLSVGRGVEMLTGFEGYLALQTLSWGPMILSVYLIPQAMRAVALEERQGTLDILLSTPISRWRFLVEKLVAIIVSLLIILSVMGLCMLIGVILVGEVTLDPGHAVAGLWHLIPISLVILLATLLLSMALRESRHAGPLAAMLVIVSYFARIMSDLTPHPLLEAIKPFSMFSYYRSIAALSEGFQWNYDVVLLTAAAVLFGLTLLAFHRRDLGV